MDQARKDRINELRRKLAGLTEVQRQELTARGIIATIEGRTLSLHNTLMVYIQCNGQAPSIVGGYQQWRKAGRQVSKGQHGYTILFPAGNKDKETGDIIDATRFFAGTIFDIAQTEVIEDARVTTAPAPKGDTARADFRVSGIVHDIPITGKIKEVLTPGDYKHTYNIYPECPAKAAEVIKKQLEVVESSKYRGPTEVYPVNHYPIIIGMNNKGPAQPYGDIDIMVDGKPGISFNGDNKAGKVKSFMRKHCYPGEGKIRLVKI